MVLGMELVIDPNFVRPDPTPADFFCCMDDPGTPEARREAMAGVLKEWERQGVAQMRATITGPDIEGDKSGYPAGLWFTAYPLATCIALAHVGTPQ